MSEADRFQLETERVTIRDSAFSFITGSLHARLSCVVKPGLVWLSGLSQVLSVKDSAVVLNESPARRAFMVFPMIYLNRLAVLPS